MAKGLNVNRVVNVTLTLAGLAAMGDGRLAHRQAGQELDQGGGLAAHGLQRAALAVGDRFGAGIAAIGQPREADHAERRQHAGDGQRAGSGVASSVLTVDTATLSANSCGSYTGSPSTISGTADQTGLSNSTCYRFVLTGTDNVGNTSSVSTVVKVFELTMTNVREGSSRSRVLEMSAPSTFASRLHARFTRNTQMCPSAE